MAETEVRKSKIPLDFSSKYTLIELQKFVEEFNNVRVKEGLKTPAKVIEKMSKGNETEFKKLSARFKALKAANLATDEKVTTLKDFNEEIDLLKDQVALKSIEARTDSNEKLAAFRQLAMARSSSRRSLFWGRVGKFLTLLAPVVIGVGFIFAVPAIFAGVATALGAASSIASTIGTAVALYAAGWGLWKGGLKMYEHFTEKFNNKILNAQKALDTLEPETQKAIEQYTAGRELASKLERNSEDTKIIVREMEATEEIKADTKTEIEKLLSDVNLAKYSDDTKDAISTEFDLDKIKNDIEKADTRGQVDEIKNKLADGFDKYLTEEWEDAVKYDNVSYVTKVDDLYNKYNGGIEYSEKEKAFFDKKIEEFEEEFKKQKTKPSQKSIDALMETLETNLKGMPKQADIEAVEEETIEKFKDTFATPETFNAAKAAIESARTVITSKEALETYKTSLEGEFEKQKETFATQEEVYSEVLKGLKEKQRTSSKAADKSMDVIDVFAKVMLNPSLVALTSTDKYAKDSIKTVLELGVKNLELSSLSTTGLSDQQKNMLAALRAEYDSSAYSSEDAAKMEVYIVQTALSVEGTSTPEEIAKTREKAIKELRENVSEAHKVTPATDTSLPVVKTPVEQAVDAFSENPSTSTYQKALINAIFSTESEADEPTKLKYAAKIKGLASENSQEKFDQKLAAILKEDELKNMTLNKGDRKAVAKEAVNSKLEEAKYSARIRREAIKRAEGKIKEEHETLKAIEGNKDLFDSASEEAKKLNKTVADYKAEKTAIKTARGKSRTASKGVRSAQRELDKLENKSATITNLDGTKSFLFEADKSKHERLTKEKSIAETDKTDAKTAIKTAKGEKKKLQKEYLVATKPKIVQKIYEIGERD